MPAAEALGDAGVLAPEPTLEFQGFACVERLGGLAFLSWRADEIEARRRGVATGSSQPSKQDCKQAVVHLQKSRSATQRDVAWAWGELPVGGRLLLCGDNDLGIVSAVKRLAAELGQVPEVLANRSHGRIVRFQRTSGPGPAVPAPSTTLLYPAELSSALDEPPLVVTMPGVFSEGELDPGTAQLQIALSSLKPVDSVADLGCGAGHLGLMALRLWPNAHAVFADAYRPAIASTLVNATTLGCAERCEAIWWDANEQPPTSGCDLALVNPPFHRGHARDLGAATAMFRALRTVVRPGGRSLIVANRRLPYEADLAELGQVSVLSQAQGFKVIEVLHAA